MMWDDTGERAVILDSRGSTLITLNPVGTILWHELAEARDTHELSRRLAAAFPDVDREQIHDDVEDFVSQLLDEGIILTIPDQP